MGHYDHHYCLVVTGEQQGTIWEEWCGRGCSGFLPVVWGSQREQLTFLPWYESMLELCVREDTIR